MKDYICYYNCPFCSDPCCDNPEEESNECISADNKAEARKFFNNCKQCRHMKITRIEEMKSGFSNVSVEIDGTKHECNSLSEAIDLMCKAYFAKHEKN